MRPLRARSALAILLVVAPACAPPEPPVPDAVFGPTDNAQGSSDDTTDLVPVPETPSVEPGTTPVDTTTMDPATSPTPAEMAAAATASDRASAAWHALTQHMKAADTPGLFHERDDTRDAAFVWSFSQVFAGALDRAQVTGHYYDVDSMRQALGLYHLHDYYAITVHPSDGTQRFFDDNAWIGLDLLQAHAQTHDRRYLDMALNLYPFIRSGMDTRTGGEGWQAGVALSPSNEGVPSTGSAAMFALRLHMATGDARFLADGERMYQYMVRTQRGSDGLYHEVRSYDDGLGIGAGVLLYRITHEQHYLDEASETARATLARYGDDGFFREWAAFNAIFFRNLLALDALAPDPRYRATLERYLERAWRDARDPATGLFDRGGIGLYGDLHTGHMNALDQGAFVQLYALLAWPHEQLGDVF